MKATGRHTKRVRSGELHEPTWPPPHDAGYADHLFLADGQPLSHAAYLEALEAMGRVVSRLERGDVNAARDWEPALQALGVPPSESSGERPDARWMPPTTAQYATMALDADPALVDDATAALLGPWAAQLSRADVLQRRAMVAAVAAACFTIPPGADRSGFRTWYRDKPQPGRWHRERVRVACRSPYAAWRLVDQTSDGWTMAPLMPIRAWWCPDDPVLLNDVGGVDGGPRKNGLLFARLVPSPDGWRAIAPITLPRCPPSTLLRGWTAAVEDPQRVVNRMLRREDALHRRGHVVCAWAHHWWWGLRHGGHEGELGSDIARR